MADRLRLMARLLLGLILPIVIIAGAVMAARYLLETGPQAERRGGGPREARLVEVVRVEAKPQRITVQAMGQVTAARQIVLRPRVSGAITSVEEEFIPGGYFGDGEEILTIDPTDYELAVDQAEAALATAQSDLALEKGQQEIARQEFELLGDEMTFEDTNLVLRQPQLESAEAAIKNAEANVRAAKLNLERTTIQAPFNAMVLNRGVELGAYVTPSTDLAELADTDQFWVVLSVPVEDLHYIEVPNTPGEQGSTVQIHSNTWQADQFRQGRVLRLNGALDPASRLAELLVAVDDPMALKSEQADQPALLINSYVTGAIEGRAFESLVALPREYLREGDTVWVMNGQDKLEVRNVQIVYHGRDEVLISEGLAGGERVVMTNLTTPVEGMGLRVAAPAEQPAAGGRAVR